MLPPPQLARLREHALGQTGGAHPFEEGGGHSLTVAAQREAPPRHAPGAGGARYMYRSRHTGQGSRRGQTRIHSAGAGESYSRRLSPEHRCGRRIGAASPNIKKRPVHQDGSQLVKKPGRARQGRSPLELQSNPAACTPDSRQFLRRGACPPEKKLLPCRFAARALWAQANLCRGGSLPGELAPPPPACLTS